MTACAPCFKKHRAFDIHDASYSDGRVLSALLQPQYVLRQR